MLLRSRMSIDRGIWAIPEGTRETNVDFVILQEYEPVSVARWNKRASKFRSWSALDHRLAREHFNLRRYYVSPLKMKDQRNERQSIYTLSREGTIRRCLQTSEVTNHSFESTANRTPNNLPKQNSSQFQASQTHRLAGSLPTTGTGGCSMMARRSKPAEKVMCSR